MHMNVTLSHHPAAKPWNPDAAFSLQGTDLVFHIPENDPYFLRKLQRTAKTCQTLPCRSFHLKGNAWTFERQWAFYSGISHPTKLVSITADLTDPLYTQRIATATWLKKLLNGTPDEIYPAVLIREIDAHLKSLTPYLTSQFIEGEDLLSQGWIGTYTVGKGSQHTPAIAIYDYNPTQNPNAPVSAILVGKGITFDSGGYSLKTSEGMISMKMDKGGAVTVAAALSFAISQGLRTRVKVIIASAENMVNSRAYKLGDILSYKNGETVEILNTDAEGRLVLADALQIASLDKPQWIIDAATLTGAIGTALADEYSGLFTQHNALAEKILAAGKTHHDPLWRMPLEAWHRDNLPSAFAKFATGSIAKGGGIGGSSNAAGFLTRFVDPSIPFAHLDIAYSIYHEQGNSLYGPGANGRLFTVLSHLLLNHAL